MIDEVFLLPVAGKCVNFDNSDRRSRTEKLKSFWIGISSNYTLLRVHCFEANSARKYRRKVESFSAPNLSFLEYS